MTETDNIVTLIGVTDRKKFFSELLAFFAPHQVILTTWGEVPAEVQERLAAFRASCSWLRRHAFHQSEWHLTPQSLPLLTHELCDDRVLRNLTWGLIKSGTPLGLCRSWDDMSINGSELIDEPALFRWLDDLKARHLLQSYEKIMD